MTDQSMEDLHGTAWTRQRRLVPRFIQGLPGESGGRIGDRLHAYRNDRVSIAAARHRDEPRLQERVHLALAQQAFGARLQFPLAIADKRVGWQIADLALVARLHVPAAGREPPAEE